MRYFFLLALLFWSCQKNIEEAGTGYISLSPHCTEIIYALGAQDKLLAVSDFCNYPEEVREKISIGGLLNPNLEKIIALKPDILFGIPAHNELALKLKSYVLETKIYPNETLGQILTTIDSIGYYTNKIEEAAKLVKSIKDSLGKFKVHSERPLTAMLIIGRDQDQLRNIMVAGPETFLSEIWQQCGGQNIFGDLKSKYSVVSREAILIRNPDIIVELGSGDNSDVKSNRLTQWKKWPELSAVKKNKVFFLDRNYSLIPGPRVHLLARDFFNIIIGNKPK